jgi:hypothetical protein
LTGTPKDGQISRRQLAKVLVRSLVSPSALRKTLELHSARGREQQNFDEVFDTLEIDVAGELDAVRDPPNMPVDREPERIVRELDAVRIQSQRRQGGA